MLSRVWIINILLAVAVVVLGLKVYGVWLKETREPPSVDIERSTIVPQKTVSKIDFDDESEYDTVISQNLFSKFRSPHEEKKTETNTKPKPGPDPRRLKALKETVKRISIYGIMMINGQKKALIRSPVTPVLGNRRSKAQPPRAGEVITWVKIGDAVNQFTVDEIRPTGVVLKAEGLDFDIVLYDEDKPKQRAPEKRAAGPVVIDTGKGPEAKSPPQKPKAPEEKVPERKLPVEAGQKAPAPEDASQKTEPQKR